ncbi:GntP family permease [Pseudomonas moraviensis]|uniref:GntP family permease n=1 Tax=Pseudomonas moraviensis TaxID=321662 RepID=UPI00215FE310|nr:GntP family permease [Pseudomonas moraviensis]UVL46883.1 GntP family permease [Pseudomonas moraviensis]
MTPSFGYWLLVYAAVAIIALIVLIARYRLNPFIVITLISLGLALVAGMPTNASHPPPASPCWSALAAA